MNETKNGETAIEKHKPEALQTLPEQKPMALMPQTFEAMLSLAEILAKSAIVPRAYQGKPADCFGAMQYGAELGMMPFAAIRNVIMIDGTPSLYARAQMGVCLSKRDCEFFRENLEESKRDEISVWECKRKGTIYRGQFSIEDAKKAKLLGKQNWQGYTHDMLENRAIARAARKAYADIFAGIQTPDEIIDLREVAPNEFSAPDVPPVVEVIEAEAVEPELDAMREEYEAAFVEIQNVKDIAELKGTAATCKLVKDKNAELGAMLLDAYGKRRAELEKA